MRLGACLLMSRTRYRRSGAAIGLFPMRSNSGKDALIVCTTVFGTVAKAAIRGSSNNSRRERLRQRQRRDLARGNGRSNFWHRPVDLLQQRARPVPLAPTLDIGP